VQSIPETGRGSHLSCFLNRALTLPSEHVCPRMGVPILQDSSRESSQRTAVFATKARENVGRTAPCLDNLMRMLYSPAKSALEEICTDLEEAM
jgi:hypothetical protein